MLTISNLSKSYTPGNWLTTFLTIEDGDIYGFIATPGGKNHHP